MPDEDDDFFIEIQGNGKLDGLDVIGSAVNWWDGTFSPSIIEYNFNMRNKYLFNNLNKTFAVPDEVLVVSTPMFEEDAEVTVQSNLNEYAGAVRKTFGFSVGFGGVISLGGSRQVGKGKSIFRAESVRTTMTDLRSTYYTLNLLPPQYLKLKDSFIDIFNALPRYDETTKGLWFKQLKKYGTHVVISTVQGGKMHMEQEIDMVHIGEKDSRWVQSQAKVTFLFLTAPTPEKKKEYEKQIDKDFRVHEKHEVNYFGGDTSIPFDQSSKWLPSVPQNLTNMRLRTIPYSELFPVGQVREDLDEAINGFLAQHATVNIQPFLGPEEPVARDSDGARIDVSSIKTECHKKCSSFCCKRLWCKPKTVCTQFPTQNSLIRANGGEFSFNSGDMNQHAVVHLSQSFYLSRVVARVASPGNARPVSLAKLNTGEDWAPIYGEGHSTFPSDGSCNFKTQGYPKLAQKLTFSFGPSPPGVGSSVFHLQAFAIKQSTPAGYVTSVTLNEVVGWAFDPLDPLKPLPIEILCDGKVIANGETGINLPDINKNYNLPANAKVGFKLALSLPASPQKRYEVLAVWKGLTQSGRSQTANLWNYQPSGKILSATPSLVEGWAYHPHMRAESYKVRVYVDDKEVGVVQTNHTSSTVNDIYSIQGKYGWKMPVSIKAAGQHVVKAKVILPNGQENEIPDSAIVDLRYPKGLIFNVTPSYVTGFAYDPNRPNDPATIQVYVDDQLVKQGQTNIEIPELNDMYLIEGKHGFNMSLRMQGGKIHLVSVYVMVNGTVRSLIETKSISIGLDDGGDDRLSTGIINYAGVGYDPCSGEWRLRVVDLNYKKGKRLTDSYWEPSKLRGLPVPDELEFERHSKVSYVNNTIIFNNTKDWAKYESHSWKAGLSLGLIGFGKSYRKTTYESLFENKMGRLGVSERKIELFKATVAPPELISFTSYAGDTFKKLPPYNPVTRPQYFRAFDLFGVAYAKELRLGGKMQFEATYLTKNTSSARYEFESSQFNFMFTFYVSAGFSHEKANAKANIDKAFMESTKRSVRLVGGTPENYSPEDSVEWTKTIIANPAVVDMELESITVLLDPEDKQRKEWLNAAIVDYVRTCTPDRWVCDELNIATLKDNAKIIHHSSIHPEGNNGLKNVLMDPKKHTEFGHKEYGFVFADNDQNQQFILELYDIMTIRKISVDVEILPSERGVWDFIKVEVSKDMKSWNFWGMVGERNGVKEVLREHYDFPVLNPEKLRYVRFSFGGPQEPSTKGSRIKRVYAYTCV